MPMYPNTTCNDRKVGPWTPQDNEALKSKIKKAVEYIKKAESVQLAERRYEREAQRLGRLYYNTAMPLKDFKAFDNALFGSLIFRQCNL